MKTIQRFVCGLILLPLLLSSCSKTLIPYQRTGEVQAIEHERAIIKVESSTRASNDDAAVNYAERQAFENILFKGIPNSNQEVGLIANEAKAWSNNKSTLDNLFSNGGYLRFILSSESTDVVRQDGVVFLTQDVKIDLAALRKYLVSEKVINSFGL